MISYLGAVDIRMTRGAWHPLPGKLAGCSRMAGFAKDGEVMEIRGNVLLDGLDVNIIGKSRGVLCADIYEARKETVNDNHK